MPSGEDIGVGVIGAGAMGRLYCECLRRHVRGARLVALAGGRRAADLARDYEVPAEASVEALLARGDLTAAIIASPETAHCAQAVAAAAHRKHVLVEKPMAPDVTQCDAMISACADAGVKLMVVKHWRFRGVHTRARAIIEAGELGRVHTIHNETGASLASSLHLVRNKPFYLDPRGGGLLMGWAVHNLDWVCHLLDADPERVGTVEPFRKHPVVGLTHLQADLEFPRRIVASVKVSIDLPQPPRSNRVFHTRLHAEGGELELDGYGALSVVKDGQREVRWRQAAFDPGNPADPGRLAAYAAMVESFFNAVREGGPSPVPGEEGRRAVALFRRLVASAPEPGFPASPQPPHL